MKKLFGIFLLSAALACGLYAAPARGTADYYVQNSAKYDGKNIKVFVTGVEQSNKVAPDGYVALRGIYGFRQDIFHRPPEVGAKVFQFRAKAECKFQKRQVVQRNFQESQARRRAGLGNCIEIGN